MPSTAVTQLRSTPSIPAYVPTRPLGSGPDGSAVLATAGTDPVELRFLSRAAGERWREIALALRSCAIVEHPGVRAVREVSESDPPVVALAWGGDATLADRIAQGPILAKHATQLAERIAHAAGAVHRVGLFHGELAPSLVQLDSQGVPRIEVTGIRTWDAAAFAPLDRMCLAPEHSCEGVDRASDVYSIGAMTLAMLLGRAPSREELRNAASLAEGPLGALLAAMLCEARDERPSAAEVVLALREAAPVRASTFVRAAPSREPIPAPGERPLGRYQIVRRIGEGGMGEVFEAIDRTVSRAVAIKVLKTEIASDEILLRRFRKEARMLAQVRSPFVANLLDVNIDGGVHYIALEYVEGPSVGDVLQSLPGRRMAERTALEIAADVCRALAAPHRIGIVHRDVKPENVMFARTDRMRGSDGALVKLCDFGIARASGDATPGTVQLTQEGMLVGTPLFMAPEQCAARPVSPATDVYSLGCALFELIAGRTPFVDEEPMALLLKHVHEAPPPLESVASVSEATAAIVARALAKDPKDRFPDAGEMLDAIEKVLRGEPTEIAAHPRVPEKNASTPRVFEVQMDLEASPEALWPYVCNSERLNRAVGMPAPTYETVGLSQAREDVRTIATNRVGGTKLIWRESPFEWVEGRRWGSFREFESGPFHWFIVETELARRAGGGTRLTWRMRYVPRSWLMAVVIGLEMKLKQGPIMRKVFARVDALVTGKLARSPENDAFELASVKLPRGADVRVQKIAADLVAAGIDPIVVEHVASYVRHGSDFEMARIRPIEFAERFSLPVEATIEAFLHAARRGLFEIGWDVLCPLCRVPSDFRSSLSAIAEHANCPTCNLDYDLDFARSIELVLRASPAIRKSERKRYCVGGPFLFPHVSAQVRLAAGERFVLTLGLEAGTHRIRSPQLANTLELRVSASAPQTRLDLELGAHSPREGDVAHLTAGEQHFVLTNTLERDIVVRIERMGVRHDALSAARVSSMAAFRELFPDEVLAPGRLVSMTNAAFVRTEVDGAESLFARLGDGPGFEAAMKHVRAAQALAQKHGGAIVKTLGAGTLATFDLPGAAAQFALEIHREGDPSLPIRAAAHAGPVMATTLNDKLDYFGQTMASLEALLARTERGRTTLGRGLCEEPDLAPTLRALGSPAVVAVAGGEVPLWGLSYPMNR